MILPLGLAAIWGVCAQDPGEARAREVVERTVRRYREARGLGYAAVVVDTAAGGTSPDRAEAAVLLRGRDRLRLELSYRLFDAPAQAVVVARGSDVLEYRSAPPEHVARTLKQGLPPTVLPDLAGQLYLGGSPGLFLPPAQPDAPIEWRVTESPDAVRLTAQVSLKVGQKVESSIYEWTIDASTGLLRRWRCETRRPDAPVRVREIEYLGVRLDAEAPDASFEFVPPAASRAVDAFTDPALRRLDGYVGRKLPDVEVVSHERKPAKLSELTRGRVALVSHWTSGLPDCIVTINHFNVVFDRFGEDVRIVLLSFEAPEELTQFYRVTPTQPRWEAPFYSTGGSLGEPFSLTSHLPLTFLLDRDGTIRHIFLGAAKESSRYVRKVDEVLRRK
jgi:peroxiredoxin